MASPREILDALIDLFVPDIRSAFLGAMQDVVDNAIINAMVKAIGEGDLEAAFRALGFSDAAMRPITAAIERAYEQGGVMTGKTFPKFLNTPSGKVVFRFDVRNSRAEAWLRDHSSSLITRLTEDARAGVRNLLTEGMQAGRNPRSVALDIVGRIDPQTGRRVGGIIGLTQQQERWSSNVRRELQDLSDNYFTRALRDKRFDRIVAKAIREGTPLDNATVEKLVGRYRDNALRYRGETIARTEAVQSLNRSEYEAHRQAIDLGAMKESAVKRIWDSVGDNRVRWSHRKMEGQAVGMDEPFVSPSGAKLLFPGDTSLGAGGDETIMCRCRVRLKVSWLDDLD
ncbi:head morphogenesis protein [Mesorhizobium sp. M1A.F.Ca.ET.072.01.1.1]|uniref:phage minor head protein n=1 Tax=Mesorhizobium sp. M1A.F.Ca.ET.072.01.1.1 TaxID=2496753 RepID=UPI000FD5939E|nr:phage minor head protein [Mesorhizobium sp. M1A.F.Ca.ET.072.01.1.1]RUW55608.1 head morphogenesis protein [Mesorhizobium sp. M1A.F.Ca.ET.072.01.1.1]